MRTEEVDVLVVGSGFGGAVTACRLAPRSRVLVLEKGKRWRPEEFEQSFDPFYLSRLYDIWPGPNLGIVTGTGVGGGSLVYSMVSLRTPSAAFDWTDPSGRRFWPDGFDRAFLDPYYARVERMLDVTQLRWHPDPDPAEAWRTVSRRDVVFARGLDRIGASCEALPLALRGCTDCGYCSIGCRPGAKQSLDKNYLARAEAAGAEIRSGCRVESIGRAPGGGWLTRYADLAAGERRLVRSRLLALAAGAIGTAALLLGARRRGALRGLSGQLGRNLSLNGDLAAGGIVPDHDVDCYRGKIDGSITYEFWDEGFTLQCVRYPIAYLSVGFPYPVVDGEGRRWGPGYKDRLREMVRHHLPIGVLGRDDSEGSVRLGGTGLPYVTFRPTARTMRMWEASLAASRRIVEDGLGGRLLPTALETHNLIGTVHPLGTARIGDDPSRGVADVHGEVFGQPGLFVVDGAALPGPIGVNTSLTIAALAERFAEGMLERIG